MAKIFENFDFIRYKQSFDYSKVPVIRNNHTLVLEPQLNPNNWIDELRIANFAKNPPRPKQVPEVDLVELERLRQYGEKVDWGASKIFEVFKEKVYKIPVFDRHGAPKRDPDSGAVIFRNWTFTEMINDPNAIAFRATELVRNMTGNPMPAHLRVAPIPGLALAGGPQIQPIVGGIQPQNIVEANLLRLQMARFLQQANLPPLTLGRVGRASDALSDAMDIDDDAFANFPSFPGQQQGTIDQPLLDIDIETQLWNTQSFNSKINVMLSHTTNQGRDYYGLDRMFNIDSGNITPGEIGKNDKLLSHIVKKLYDGELEARAIFERRFDYLSDKTIIRNLSIDLNVLIFSAQQMKYEIQKKKREMGMMDAQELRFSQIRQLSDSDRQIIEKQKKDKRDQIQSQFISEEEQKHKDDVKPHSTIELFKGGESISQELAKLFGSAPKKIDSMWYLTNIQQKDKEDLFESFLKQNILTSDVNKGFIGGEFPGIFDILEDIENGDAHILRKETNTYVYVSE